MSEEEEEEEEEVLSPPPHPEKHQLQSSGPDSNMAAIEDEVDDRFKDIDIETLLSRVQRRPLTFSRKKSVYTGRSVRATSTPVLHWH